MAEAYWWEGSEGVRNPKVQEGHHSHTWRAYTNSEVQRNQNPESQPTKGTLHPGHQDRQLSAAMKKDTIRLVGTIH